MWYRPISADFDGSSDYLLRGGGLTSAADGKLGIFSAWIRLDGGDGGTMFALQGHDSRFTVLRAGNNKLRVIGRDASHNVILDHVSTGLYTTSTTFFHLLAAWDLGNAASFIYVDDASVGATPDVLTDDDIDYTLANWGVGSTTSGGLKLNGALSELYFAQEYLDISVEANRRKFISASLFPVWLGKDGALPTGTAPIIYMDFYTMGQNKGPGGDFTESGSAATPQKGPGKYGLPAARIHTALR